MEDIKRAKELKNIEQNKSFIEEEINEENFEIEEQDENMWVSIIKNIPDDMDGCGCAYSFTESDFRKHKLMYVDNTGYAYINIDNKLERFEIPEDRNNEYLQNENYYIRITNLKIVKRLEEGSEFKGTMIITDKIGNTRTIEIYGGCGC